MPINIETKKCMSHEHAEFDAHAIHCTTAFVYAAVTASLQMKSEFTNSSTD